MSKTKQALTTALLRHGYDKLAEVWHCDASEVGRRVKGERGIKMDDLCAALDAMGVQIVDRDAGQTVVDRKELDALRVLAQSSRVFATEDE